MFQKSKNFDFKSKVICRFTTIFDLTKNENERRFVDSAIDSAENKNERLFAACFKSEENKRRFSTSFKFVDF